MKNKTQIRSVLVVLVLFLVQYGIGFVTRQFYQHPAGRMTADIQRHNIMITENADWVFTFFVAGVWIFLYLKDLRPGYRRLCIEIAATFGIFTLIGMTISIVKVLLSSELQGLLSANISWIVMVTTLSFIKTSVLTGLLAAAVIAVINRFLPTSRNMANDVTLPDTASVPADGSTTTQPQSQQGTSVHPLVAGAMTGGVSGLLFGAAFVLLPKVLGRGMELVMFGLLPIGIMYQEFMSFDPFIPDLLRDHGKLYADAMAFLILTGLGIIVASITAYQEAKSGKKASLGLLLRISASTGGLLAIIRVLALLLMARKYAGALLGTFMAWITGALLVGLIISQVRKSGRFRYIPTLSLPLSGTGRTAAVAAMLVVTAMLTGQVLDINCRRDLSVFTLKSDKERQQRESSEGLQINNCDARWESSGDLIVTGLVTNTTNVHKAWFIDAKTLDKNERVLTTAKVVDGRQHFSLKELELLTKGRNIPECAIRAPEQQLLAKSSSRFELRLIQPPAEAVSYSLAMRTPPYNELAVNDLQDMKGALEKQYAEMEKNVGKLPEPKQPKKNAGKAQIEKLGLHVYLPNNYRPDLEATKKEEIFRQRRVEIDKYRDLEIFPANYTPNKAIFGQIDDRIGWLHDTPLFLMNPYVLVVDAGGAFVNGEFAYCPVSSIVYSRNRIDMRYENESAKKWLRNINGYKECSGTVRLWFVNAMDAGFPYVYVDPSRSENIEPIPGAPADHAMKSVLTPAEFFHVGRKGKNNISPDDARAKVKLKDPNARTAIYVKLWRKKPVNPVAPEDFSYVMRVEPGV